MFGALVVVVNVRLIVCHTYDNLICNLHWEWGTNNFCFRRFFIPRCHSLIWYLYRTKWASVAINYFWVEFELSWKWLVEVKGQCDLKLVDLDLNSRSPKVTKAKKSWFSCKNLRILSSNITKFEMGVYLKPHLYLFEFGLPCL